MGNRSAHLELAKDFMFMTAKERMASMSTILGMPYGSAYNKLRKNLLYHFAQICNLDTCYRCSKTIENVDEFSIEHKDAFRHCEDPLLAFFDIKNIAFSHLLCNTTNTKRKNIDKYTGKKTAGGINGVPLHDRIEGVNGRCICDICKKAQKEYDKLRYINKLKK